MGRVGETLRPSPARARLNMSNAATPLESPASNDGPLLSSATSALQELVFSVNSARGDMASATAEAQAEITAKLKGTAEAAANAFRDATEIANFFESECQSLQKRISAETSRRVAADAERARLATESDDLQADLHKCRGELETSRQREQSHAASLETVREDNRQLRLGEGAEGGGDSAQLGDDLAKVTADLRLALAEGERTKKQNAQLEARVQAEVQARAQTEEEARSQGDELVECTAVANAARAELEKMKLRQREAEEQSSADRAELQRLRGEMQIKMAEQTAALEQERAIHQRERVTLLDLASPPARTGSTVDDAAQSIEYELQKLRTEHAQQLASMKRDTDALKQEVERKHQSLLATHSAVEIMRDEHESFRQRTQRDASSSEQVADLKREVESLQQQLALQHKQLQLAMQGKLAPPDSPWDGKEPPMDARSPTTRELELERAIVGARETQDALFKELEAAHEDHAVRLETTERDLQRRHTAELEVLELRIKEAQDDAAVLVRERAELEATVEKMNQTLVDRQAEREEEREKLLRLEAEHADTVAGHSETQQRHAEQVQEHIEQLKELQAEADVLADEKASLERHAAEVDLALQENKSQMMAKAHELERREEDVRTEAAQQVATWEKQHQELQQAHQDVNALLLRTQDQHRIEEDAHARTAAERDELQAQHDELHEEHQIVFQERDISRVQHAEAVAAHEEAAAARDAIRAQHMELSAAHKSASDEVTKLSAHREALQSELDTAHQKAADAHRAHQEATMHASNETELLSSALQVNEVSVQTLQQELDDALDRNKRTHEELVAAHEELAKLKQEKDDLHNANYKTKEDAAVELAEMKRTLEEEVSNAKDEATHQLAEAQRTSELGYAALQERFDAQVTEVDSLKQEHARIQALWKEEAKELTAVSEASLEKYTDALEAAENLAKEAEAATAQHSSLMHDHQQKHDAHTQVSEEVEQLRQELEAMSQELTEEKAAKEALAVAVDEDKQLWVQQQAELEQAKTEALDALGKQSEQHGVQVATLRKQSEGAAAQLRRQHEAAVRQHEAAVEQLRASNNSAAADEWDAEIAAAEAAKTAAEEALLAERNRNEELTVEVAACRMEISALEEIREINDQLSADFQKLNADTLSSSEEHERQAMTHAEHISATENKHAEKLSALNAAHFEASEEAAAKLQQAHDKAEEKHAKAVNAEAMVDRLTSELAAAQSDLARVHADSEAARRVESERLTASLTVAHDSLKRMEDQRVEQSRELELKEQQMHQLQARALGGENALLRTASQALALSEGVAVPKPDPETVSPAATSASGASGALVPSRPRRGSWVSDSGAMIYECELGTGFRGTLEEVKEHEARIRKMKEETKREREERELAMPRSTRTFAAGAAATSSASDYRYGLAATASRPMASPVLGPVPTYSSSSRLPEEDLYGLTNRADLSVRSSAELSMLSIDGHHHARPVPAEHHADADRGDGPTNTSSRAAELASKAAARKQRWASAGTTSRAPRREPGNPMSEGEPPIGAAAGAPQYERRGSAAGAVQSPADVSRRPRSSAASSHSHRVGAVDRD